MNRFCITLFALLIHFTGHTQRASQMSHDTLPKGIGGELKGMYIFGATTTLVGVGFGVFVQQISEVGERRGLPLITGAISLVPGTLLGLGIASLHPKKKRTPINRSFIIGTGLTVAPLFLPTESFMELNTVYRSGINFRLLSPEIGPWRYKLGTNYFFATEHQLPDRITRRSGWDINLDLQYLIYLNTQTLLYPFIGLNVDFAQREDLNSPGGKGTRERIASNFGLGISQKMSDRWNLFFESKLTADDERDKVIFTAGVQLYLKNS